MVALCDLREIVIKAGANRGRHRSVHAWGARRSWISELNNGVLTRQLRSSTSKYVKVSEWSDWYINYRWIHQQPILLFRQYALKTKFFFSLPRKRSLLRKCPTARILWGNYDRRKLSLSKAIIAKLEVLC